MRTLLFALLLLPALASAADEREGLVQRGDKPLTLVGSALTIGQLAPDATLRDSYLLPVALRSTDGAIRVVATVPSLDTPTCSREARVFNERAAALPGVQILVVSRDLPFAQTRFCTAHGIAGVRVLSDYADASLGRAWGLLIKQNALLARAVVVLDAQGVVRYQQIVAELSDEPDYDAALAAAKELAGR
ncbi:MAG: thiol peroxidase [Planctomycetes bacterium]|nr:thiol peroxidase [Planctomycetota bacterium]